MSKSIAAVVVLVTIAATALAQDVERRREGGRRGGGPGRGPSISRIIERLNQELNFDEQQMARIDEIVAAHEERMRESQSKWQELRDALEAGDEERAAELREQLQQQRGERGQAIEAVFDEIEPLLREDQVEAFQQARERMSQRRGPGDRDRMRQMIRELPEAVNMTEKQRQEFDQLVEERQAMMRERMAERRQQRGAGEPDRDRRPDRPDFGSMYEELFEDVAQILNEDQLKLLSDYRARFEAERRRSGSRESDELQTILSAVKRIRGLSDEQRDSVRDIERDAMQSSRELRRDREGLALLAADVKAEIIKLLDRDQAEEFQQNLERLQSRGRQAERGVRDQPRRERPGRNRPEEP